MSAGADHAIRAATEGSPGRLYLEPPAGSTALQQEATNWLDTALGDRPLPPLLIVIGMGTGELLPVLARRGVDYRLLVVEPDSAAAQACARRADWTALRTAGRLQLLAGPDFKGADAAWRLFPTNPDAHLLLLHPRLKPTAETGNAAAVVKKILFGVRANAEARRRFAPRYLTNVLKNVPAMAAGRDVAALTNAYAGRPALITAAGPSLDAVMGDIPAIASRALLIATDTTLRPLLAAGVQPHLAVGADPGQANARHFRELPPRGRTWLVAESALDGTAASAFAGRTLWFRLANHHPWPWLRRHGLDVGHVEMWGSVLTAAFEVACLAGCDPIVIVGADLAFTGGRPYCRGTTYEFDWAHNEALGIGLTDTWRAQMTRTSLQKAADLHGAPTVTTSSLLSFRDWMVARAARSGRRVINASSGGILAGSGIDLQPLRDVAAAWETAVPEVDSVLAGAAAAHPDLAAELDRADRSLLDIDSAPEPIPQWREFSGEGFDAAQVSQALSASAAMLRAGTGSALLDPLIPWTTLTASTLDLSGLPERVERLRRALADGSLPATGQSPSPLLGDAFRILAGSVAALGGATDVSAVPGSPADGPLAGRYLWPEGLRWAVVLFEGLLGANLGPQAASATQTAPDTGFFGGAVTRGHALDASILASCDAAAVGLALEWIRIASAGTTSEPAEAASLSARARAVEAALLTSRPDETLDRVRLSMASQGNTTALLVPGGLDRTRLTKVTTGALRRSPGDPIALFDIEGSGMRASVDLVPAATCQTSRPSAGRLTPVILTEFGLRRSLVAYASDAGAVCVTPYSTQTTLIGHDGSARPHLHWPHPIVGALPWGESGAVAWSNGMVDGREEQAYVMYRQSPDEQVTTEAIPVRPTLGAWWHERLYWNCYPTPTNGWSGLASWAPGEDVRIERSDITLLGVLPGPHGLELHPSRFVPGVGFDPTPVTHAIHHRADGTMHEFQLDGDGPCSMRTEGEWTAAAHPQTHTIRLTSQDGLELSMVCHAPFRLAWIDGHLLVSTVERDVLLFQDLVSVLNRAARDSMATGAVR